MLSISHWLKESLAFLTSLSIHLVMVVLALLISTSPQVSYVELSGSFRPVGTEAAEEILIVEELQVPQSDNQAEFMTAEDVTTATSTADQLAISPDQIGDEQAQNAALLPSLDAAWALQAASPNPQDISLKLGNFAIGGGGEELADAYRQAQYELAKQLGGELKKLQGWGKGKIIVVKGQYDKMERVLDMYRIRYRLVETVGYRDLNDARVLLVNCGAPPIQPQTIYDFVQNGGFVVSTDWAIQNVSKAFPRDIGQARGTSGNDTVQVEFYDKGDRLMEGVRGSDGRGSWWLDSQSYFVEIRSARVTPLVTSTEMAKRYKTSDVVACVVYGGKGQLLHIVSHVFLESGDKPGIVAMHRLIFNFLLEVDRPMNK